MTQSLLSSAQIRAARALIRWSAEDLAKHSALSVATIRRAELMADVTAMTVSNNLAVFGSAGGAARGALARAPEHRSASILDDGYRIGYASGGVSLHSMRRS